MIPEIGVMVGAYIVTRMMEMLTAGHSDARARRITLGVLGIVTIFVTTITIYDLVGRGTSAATGLLQ